MFAVCNCTQRILSSRIPWSLRPLLPHSRSHYSLHDKHLGDLTRSLGRILRNTRDPAHINHFIHHKLGQTLAQSTSAPHEVYARLISYLLKHKRLKDAIDVYERMHNEGVIPNHLTQIEIAAISFAMSNPDDPRIKPVVMDLVTDPKCNEPRFLHFLELLAELDVSDDQLLHVTWMFVDSRGDDQSPSPTLLAKLVDIQTRSGQLELALKTLDRFKSPGPAPYAAMIRSLTNIDVSDEDAVSRVLDKMKVEEVLPDVGVFNALISREVRQPNLGDAFSLYRHLVSLSVTSGDTVTPNVATFAIFFKFLAKAFTSNMRRTRLRTYKINPNSVPPRQLFRDLFFFHRLAIKASPKAKTWPLLSVPFLNLTLRAFLQLYDYPAAAIVLMTFRWTQLSPDARTYLAVVRHIVRHIHLNCRFDSGAWTVRFIKGSGDGKDPELVAMISGMDQGTLAQNVLDAACQSGVRLTGDLLNHKGVREFWVPKASLLEGETPEGGKYDLAPLHRLVDRAIIAQLETMGGAIRSDDEKQEGTIDYSYGVVRRRAQECVDEAVKAAKLQMFPSDQHPYAITQDINENLKPP